MNAKKLSLSALFVCFAAALSALETMLPPIVPIAGVRVGLGNIVTLFVLYIGGSWHAYDALCVAVLRCVLAALITGSPLSAVYGIAGGVLACGASTLARTLLPKTEGGACSPAYLPFAGIFGAAAHIAGQLAVAVIVYGSAAVLVYTPILLASAVVGGAFTGLCTMLLLKKLPQKALDAVKNP